MRLSYPTSNHKNTILSWSINCNHRSKRIMCTDQSTIRPGTLTWVALHGQYEHYMHLSDIRAIMLALELMLFAGVHVIQGSLIQVFFLGNQSHSQTHIRVDLKNHRGPAEGSSTTGEKHLNLDTREATPSTSKAENHSRTKRQITFSSSSYNDRSQHVCWQFPGQPGDLWILAWITIKCSIILWEEPLMSSLSERINHIEGWINFQIKNANPGIAIRLLILLGILISAYSRFEIVVRTLWCYVESNYANAFDASMTPHFIID